MIGRILSRLLGNAGDDLEAAGTTFEEPTESEEGGWVIVDLPGETQNHILVSESVLLIK